LDTCWGVGSGAGFGVSDFLSDEHDTAAESKATETTVPQVRCRPKVFVVISAMI
jgi:hypothetical protein